MDKNFETHKAKLLLHNDNFWIIDFRREDGRCHYWVRFFIDTESSEVHISGDLGYCISRWGNSNSIQNISEMMLNTNYWMEKFMCSSNSYTWDEEKAKKELCDDTNDYYEECSDHDEYYDMIEEIMNTFDYSTGITLCTTEAQRCWHELGLEESSPMYYGRKIHPRVKLWAEAFDLALQQLGLK